MTTGNTYTIRIYRKPEGQKPLFYPAQTERKGITNRVGRGHYFPNLHIVTTGGVETAPKQIIPLFVCPLRLDWIERRTRKNPRRTPWHSLKTCAIYLV